MAMLLGPEKFTNERDIDITFSLIRNFHRTFQRRGFSCEIFRLTPCVYDYTKTKSILPAESTTMLKFNLDY